VEVLLCGIKVKQESLVIEILNALSKLIDCDVNLNMV